MHLLLQKYFTDHPQPLTSYAPENDSPTGMLGLAFRVCWCYAVIVAQFTVFGPLSWWKYCSILFADSLSRNSVRPRREVFKNIEIHVMYRVGRLTKLLALSSWPCSTLHQSPVLKNHCFSFHAVFFFPFHVIMVMARHEHRQKMISWLYSNPVECHHFFSTTWCGVSPLESWADLQVTSVNCSQTSFQWTWISKKTNHSLVRLFAGQMVGQACGSSLVKRIR